MTQLCTLCFSAEVKPRGIRMYKHWEYDNSFMQNTVLFLGKCQDLKYDVAKHYANLKDNLGSFKTTLKCPKPAVNMYLHSSRGHH